MNVNALVLEIARREINVSTRDYRQYFFPFFNIMDEYLNKLQGHYYDYWKPEWDSNKAIHEYYLNEFKHFDDSSIAILRDNKIFGSFGFLMYLAKHYLRQEIRIYFRQYDQLGGIVPLKEAFSTLREALITVLCDTFPANVDDNPRELRWIFNTGNIDNGRFIGFLDKLSKSDLYAADGDEAVLADSVFERLDNLVELGYTRPLYAGILGNFSGLGGDVRNRADQFRSLMAEMLEGLASLRARAHAGVSEGIYGSKSEGTIEIGSERYVLTLEETLKTEDQPQQTFAEAFQDYVVDYKTLAERTRILRTDLIAIQATIQSIGVAEWRYSKNGGPIQ